MRRNLFCRVAGVFTIFCVATATAAHAQTFTRIARFNKTNGASPSYGSLLQGTDGDLYGETTAGGTFNGGTVFKIGPNGALTVVYSFCAQDHCLDGSGPQSGFVQGVDGNFYGATEQGGANRYGTVFKLTPEGALTTVHSFCSAPPNCADGIGAGSTLIQMPYGNLYGATSVLSTSNGTIYDVSPNGQFSTVYTFCSQTNCGAGGLAAGLVFASDGTLYGSTPDGGTKGYGSIFSMNSANQLTTLYSFQLSDGDSPNAIIQGADGNIYGTTYGGGAHNKGVIFKMTLDGQFTDLYSFCSLPNCADGKMPYAGLAQGSDGNFYGTTTYGGVGGHGTVFQITPAGVLTTLYAFCKIRNCLDGEFPVGGITQGTDGNLYGTTFGLQCPSKCGTVFRISMGLPPLTIARPNFGQVSDVVSILGNNLKGTSKVTFDGVAASFDVVSSSLIQATVPSGATTGTIEVTTPNGTLKSNVAFQVLP